MARPPELLAGCGDNGGVRLGGAPGPPQHPTGPPQCPTGPLQHPTGRPQHPTGPPQHPTGCPQHPTGPPQLRGATPAALPPATAAGPGRVGFPLLCPLPGPGTSGRPGRAGAVWEGAATPAGVWQRGWTRQSDSSSRGTTGGSAWSRSRGGWAGARGCSSCACRRGLQPGCRGRKSGVGRGALLKSFLGKQLGSAPGPWGRWDRVPGSRGQRGAAHLLSASVSPIPVWHSGLGVSDAEDQRCPVLVAAPGALLALWVGGTC